MKCAHCDNVSLNRYGFLLSTIFYRNNNVIECDKCNNLSKIKNFELLFLRLIVYFFIIGGLYVICTINQFSYNENVLSYFSLAFITIISSSILVTLEKDNNHNKKNIYINISNDKYISNKSLFLYI